MHILRLTSIFLVLFALNISGQNIRIGGDGATTADPSAILELDGTNSQGFFVPQMTEAQRLNFGPTLATSPDNGSAMMVYQTDGEQGLYYWEGDRWMKYKPFGYAGVVGTNWDTITNTYVFSTTNVGFTGLDLAGTGEFQVNFDTPFDTYPTITLTAEPLLTPLPSTLPVPDVTCTPSFSANCTDDFNSDQMEAVRIASNVVIGGASETQVILNGSGFLPPVGPGANGCAWPQSWMAGSPPQSNGNIPNTFMNPAGTIPAYISILAGGCWGTNTDCILQMSDPCVQQNGGGNYGRYLPDGFNASVNSFCNNIYHPFETTNGGTAALDTPQDNQTTIRIGNDPTDNFEIYLESSPHWSDAMAAFIDWNRDGDFADDGEFLGQMDPPPCTGQGFTNSGCSGPGQLGTNPNTHPDVIFNAAAGQFRNPDAIGSANVIVEYGLTNLRVYSTWTGGTNSSPTLWDEPCRTSTWGETEDFVVEIYDDATGSVVGVGADFSYTPAVCGIAEVIQTGANYTGFRVECTDALGTPMDTKFHFDVTKFAVY